MAVLVIVPASFAPVAMYDEWVAHLAEHGVRAVVVDLPSVGPREGLPPQTMTDDANEISKVAGELLDSGEDVVLLTHSYGGIPGTQSLEKVSHKARQAVGKSGVKTIVYMTSVVVPVGVSTFEAFQSNLPDGVTLEVLSGCPSLFIPSC